MVEYLLLAVLWIAWCTLHSAMITLSVTESLRRRLPNAFRYYRIFFNLVAVITLVPVLIYTFSLNGGPVHFAWQGLWRVVQVLLWLASLSLFMAGSRRYDLFQFLGLRQIKDPDSCSVLTDDCSLDTSDVLSLVRHPWYTGGILIIWARPLDTAAIVTNLVLTGYFIVGAFLEEQILKVQFGQEYSDYQQQVSMFVPIKWVLKRNGQTGKT